MKKPTPAGMAIGFIVLIAGIILLMISSQLGSKMNANTIEENSFSIRMPETFIELEQNKYWDEEIDSYIEIDYYPNELGLNTEAMICILMSAMTDKKDEIYIEKVKINEADAWQAQHSALLPGDSEPQQYYTGITTVFVLYNEFLVVKIFSLSERVVEDSEVREKEIELYKAIADTVMLKESGNKNVNITIKRFKADKLTSVLSDAWEEFQIEGGGHKYYGYHAKFKHASLPIWIDLKEFNNDSVNSLEDVKEHFLKDVTLTPAGNISIADEQGILYSYRAFGEAPNYFYGVVGITDHYQVNVCFIIYEDSYYLPNGTINRFAAIISDIE